MFRLNSIRACKRLVRRIIKTQRGFVQFNLRLSATFDLRKSPLIDTPYLLHNIFKLKLLNRNILCNKKP